jgi:hypothetical protein
MSKEDIKNIEMTIFNKSEISLRYKSYILLGYMKIYLYKCNILYNDTDKLLNKLKNIYKIDMNNNIEHKLRPKKQLQYDIDNINTKTKHNNNKNKNNNIDDDKNMNIDKLQFINKESKHNNRTKDNIND